MKYLAISSLSYGGFLPLELTQYTNWLLAIYLNGAWHLGLIGVAGPATAGAEVDGAFLRP